MVCGNDGGLRPNNGGACGTCVVCGNDGGFVVLVRCVVMMVGL